jgi:adenosyl cobinamide kinase/adenosyl cobinamide phosphate guanylyltransferase
VVNVITLVLGGARSGKSIVAERIAEKSAGPVTYVATMKIEGDKELEARVAAHQRRRPTNWVTIECHEDLATLMGHVAGTVLIDSLGPWLASLPDIQSNVDALCSALRQRDGNTIVVSDEVGLSVHPESPEGRRFRDQLGILNQEVAFVANDVLFVVAGRVLNMPAGQE